MWACYYSNASPSSKVVLPLQVMGVPNHRNWKSLKLDAWLVKCRNHQAEFNSFLGNLLHYLFSTFPPSRSSGLLYEIPKWSLLHHHLHRGRSGTAAAICAENHYAIADALSLVLHSTKNVWPSELRKRGSKNLQPLFHQPVGCLYLIYKRLNHLDSACLRDAGVAPQGGRKPQQNCKVEGHKWNQLWFPCAAI